MGSSQPFTKNGVTRTLIATKPSLQKTFPIFMKCMSAISPNSTKHNIQGDRHVVLLSNPKGIWRVIPNKKTH